MHIRVDDLTVEFPGTLALTDVTMDVSDGECVALLGPSGCGKSTLLNVIGGLTSPTQGSATFDGEPVRGPDPHRAAFVFQDYSLLPWSSALDNVAFGLRMRGTSRSERESVARELLTMVGLGDRVDALPGQLSGGMQQRVAVARALAMEPSTVLMDEPFGALDEITRRSIGTSLAGLLAERGVSVLMVTHSIDEAIFWADRVLVMGPSPGRIVADVAVDAPRQRSEEFYVSAQFSELRTRLFTLVEDVTPSINVPGRQAAEVG